MNGNVFFSLIPTHDSELSIYRLFRSINFSSLSLHLNCFILWDVSQKIQRQLNKRRATARNFRQHLPSNDLAAGVHIYIYKQNREKLNFRWKTRSQRSILVFLMSSQLAYLRFLEGLSKYFVKLTLREFSPEFSRIFREFSFHEKWKSQRFSGIKLFSTTDTVHNQKITRYALFMHYHYA